LFKRKEYFHRHLEWFGRLGSVRLSQSVIGGGHTGTFGFAEHRFGGFGRLKCFPCLALVVKELIPSMGVRRRGCHGGNESGSGDDQSHHGAGVSDACKKKVTSEGARSKSLRKIVRRNL